jgi:PmbA protein
MNIEQILEIARKAGASHAEVYQSASVSRPVFFEANRLKQQESSQAEGCALRLWRDNRPGLAVAYGEIEAETLVEKALAISQLNPPEEIELTEARTDIRENLGAEVTPEEFVEIGKETIAILRQNYSDLICSAEFECEKEIVTLVNSQGLYCQQIDRSTSYYFGIEWVRGEDFLSIYDGEDTKDKPNPTMAIRQILQRLEWARNNIAPPKKKVPVLLTPNAISMFWETIAAATNGKRVVEGSSPWSDRLGEIVLSEKINISQQPAREPYDCPFDDEGTPTQSLNIITNGRLQKFYSDRATAKSLNSLSTGNGFRPSLGRYPTPSLVNSIVESGSGSLEESMTIIEDGILLDRILGGGADISGDFSVDIDLGYRIRQGRVVGRVKDTMVAGNVYAALNRVIAVGADCHWSGSCYTPSVIVDGLSVVGQ